MVGRAVSRRRSNYNAKDDSSAKVNLSRVATWKYHVYHEDGSQYREWKESRRHGQGKPLM